MGSSDRLIFLHGWGTDPGVWKRQVEHFSPGYEVLTPNLPGYAKNGPRPTVHSPQQKNLRDKNTDKENNFPSIVDRRPSTVLIGWSYGGMRAIEMASEEPGRLKALVLVGCSAKFSEGVRQAVINNLIRNLGRDFEGTMRNCYGTFFSDTERGFIEEFISGSVLPERSACRDGLNRLLDMDLKEKLKTISIPTLVVHGDKDNVCPLDAGLFLHKNIKDSRMEIIEGAGHMPFYTREREFNDMLESFIDGIE